MNLKTISLAEIDPPAHQVRSQIEDEGIDDLAASIKTVGLLNPIIVKLVDSRFEVVAGHRRYLASLRANLTSVPCLVMTAEDGSDLAAKVHENLWREDLSPVEEAAFYAELLDKAANGVDEVVELVRQNRARVEGRLNLLHGDAGVLQALAEKKITLGVAEHLNKCKRPEDIRYYLGWAIAQGATVATVRNWVVQANFIAEANGGAAPGLVVLEQVPIAEAKEPTCYICGYTEPRHDVEFWYIHRACRQIAERSAREWREAQSGANGRGAAPEQS